MTRDARACVNGLRATRRSHEWGRAGHTQADDESVRAQQSATTTRAAQDFCTSAGKRVTPLLRWLPYRRCRFRPWCLQPSREWELCRRRGPSFAARFRAPFCWVLLRSSQLLCPFRFRSQLPCGGGFLGFCGDCCSFSSLSDDGVGRGGGRTRCRA